MSILIDFGFFYSLSRGDFYKDFAFNSTFGHLLVDGSSINKWYEFYKLYSEWTTGFLKRTLQNCAFVQTLHFHDFKILTYG